MAYEASSTRLNHDYILVLIATLMLLTLFSTLVTCSAIPPDTSEAIDGIAGQVTAVSSERQSANAPPATLASEIRQIADKLSTLEQMVIADRDAQPVNDALSAPTASPSAPATSANQPDIPAASPPSAPEPSVSAEAVIQDTIRTHADTSARELNTIAESIRDLNAKIETYRDNDVAWSKLGAGVSALMALVVNLCIWLSWILTIPTILLPRRYIPFVQSLRNLENTGPAGKFFALTGTLVYLCVMITGYGQSLGALLREWYAEVLPLFYPLAAILAAWGLIRVLRIPFAVKLIASLASAALIVWGVLEASACNIDPKLPAGEYYLKALFQYLSVVDWNRYAMWASMLMLIIALYMARMAIIVLDVMRVVRSPAAQAG
jgi:hypothetical protein